MPAAIEIEQSDDAFAELKSLHNWLSGKDPLRGTVVIERPAHGNNEMGWLSDVVTVALSNGGAVPVLAGSLATWLVSRRSHVKIKVTGQDGRTAEVDVKQAKGNQEGVAALLRELLAPGEDDRREDSGT